MDTSGDPQEQARPEQMLSAALRAQAAGNGTPEARPSAPAPPPAPGNHRARLPVVRVLLFALVLGVLAGAIVGTFSAT